jgi:CheY-like chemotaxis protein
MPRCSVLVVEDDTDNRELTTECLRALGFPVLEARDGADAVKCVELHHPAVVLMDLSMPGLVDGWEATRTIMRRGTSPSPVIIAVTAHSFAPYHDMALRAGCRTVVLKPVDFTALASLIEQLSTRPIGGEEITLA